MASATCRCSLGLEGAQMCFEYSGMYAARCLASVKLCSMQQCLVNIFGRVVVLEKLPYAGSHLLTNARYDRCNTTKTYDNVRNMV